MTPESRERAHEERALYHDKVSNLLDEVFAEVDRATCAGMEVAMKIPDDITVTVNPTEFACLKAEVNAVLKAFKRRRDKGQYCVNYADLRCVNVSRGIEGYSLDELRKRATGGCSDCPDAEGLYPELLPGFLAVLEASRAEAHQPEHQGPLNEQAGTSRDPIAPEDAWRDVDQTDLAEVRKFQNTVLIDYLWSAHQADVALPRSRAGVVDGLNHYRKMAKLFLNEGHKQDVKMWLADAKRNEDLIRDIDAEIEKHQAVVATFGALPAEVACVIAALEEDEWKAQVALLQGDQ